MTAREDRDGFMQYHGLWMCPQWCVQPDDEDDTEEHVSEWLTPVDGGGPDGGVTIEVRARMSWWDTDGTDEPAYLWAEVSVSGENTAPDSDRARCLLTVDDLDELRTALASVDDMLQMGVWGWVYAYDGAEEDQAAGGDPGDPVQAQAYVAGPAGEIEA